MFYLDTKSPFEQPKMSRFEGRVYTVWTQKG